MQVPLSLPFRSQLGRICHMSMPQPITGKEMGTPPPSMVGRDTRGWGSNASPHGHSEEQTSRPHQGSVRIG